MELMGGWVEIEGSVFKAQGSGVRKVLEEDPPGDTAKRATSALNAAPSAGNAWRVKNEQQEGKDSKCPLNQCHGEGAPREVASKSYSAIQLAPLFFF
jgi:hypothetical protein